MIVYLNTLPYYLAFLPFKDDEEYIRACYEIPEYIVCHEDDFGTAVDPDSGEMYRVN